MDPGEKRREILDEGTRRAEDLDARAQERRRRYSLPTEIVLAWARAQLARPTGVLTCDQGEGAAEVPW